MFGDWIRQSGSPSGAVFVARRPENRDRRDHDGQWPLAVAMKLDQYLLGFGEDGEGELYVMTSERQGPSGNTGRVWRIVRAP